MLVHQHGFKLYVIRLNSYPALLFHPCVYRTTKLKLIQLEFIIFMLSSHNSLQFTYLKPTSQGQGT